MMMIIIKLWRNIQSRARANIQSMAVSPNRQTERQNKTFCDECNGNGTRTTGETSAATAAEAKITQRPKRAARMCVNLSERDNREQLNKKMKWNENEKKIKSPVTHDERNAKIS